MIKNIERTRDGMDSLIDRTRDAVVDATGRAERGVESAAERVVQGTHTAGDAIRDGAKTVSRDAHVRVRGAARTIERGYARASSDVSRVVNAGSDYVAENPAKALLLTLSAGFVLGLLVRGRRV